MKIGMISCRERATTARAQTLVQFGGDLHVEVFEDDCAHPAPANVLRNAHTVMSALHPGGVLFCEDDIDLHQAAFREWLPLVERFDQITALCLLRDSLWPAGVPASPAGDTVARFLPLRDYDVRRGFHGTMCIYIPPRVVQYITEHPEEFHQNGRPIAGADGFDFWIKMNAAAFGGLYGAYPNPVNHRPGYSTWTRGNQPKRWQDIQSHSYWATPVFGEVIQRDIEDYGNA